MVTRLDLDELITKYFSPKMATRAFTLLDQLAGNRFVLDIENSEYKYRYGGYGSLLGQGDNYMKAISYIIYVICSKGGLNWGVQVIDLAPDVNKPVLNHFYRDTK